MTVHGSPSAEILTGLATLAISVPYFVAARTRLMDRATQWMSEKRGDRLARRFEFSFRWGPVFSLLVGLTVLVHGLIRTL